MAMVAIVEPMGAETLIQAQFDGGNITLSFRGKERFKAGDRLPMRLDTQRAHVFDARTGEKLQFYNIHLGEKGLR